METVYDVYDPALRSMVTFSDLEEARAYAWGVRSVSGAKAKKVVIYLCVWQDCTEISRERLAE